jgi:FkbM family methyltransferase
MNSKLLTALVVIAGIFIGAFPALWLTLGRERVLEMLSWAADSKPACGNPSFRTMWQAAHEWSVAEARFSRIRRVQEDPSLGLTQYSVGDDTYWIPSEGGELAGEQLIWYLLVEHAWMEKLNPSEQVRPGDIVIDCGAHVGVFTRRALTLGARKVLAVEPAPQNVKCLNRNFRSEIQSGRVLVVPKGAWDKEGTLLLKASNLNSGNNSFVYEKSRSAEISVDVATLDSMVQSSELPTVNYLKMDIEGAERRALRGAAKIISRYKPRLSLEFYHLEDDPVVLPAIVMELNPGYQLVRGPCFKGDGRGWRPHVVYYH